MVWWPSHIRLCWALLCQVGTETSAPPIVDFSLDREHLVVFNSVVWWFELLPSARLYMLTELKQGHPLEKPSRVES